VQRSEYEKSHANGRHVLGIAAGIVGLEHGYSEILPGCTCPESLMIVSIGPSCVPEEIWNTCEPAMTVIPNFLMTGILAVIIGLVTIAWSVAFIQRKYGGLVLLPLSVYAAYARDATQ